MTKDDIRRVIREYGIKLSSGEVVYTSMEIEKIVDRIWNQLMAEVPL